MSKRDKVDLGSIKIHKRVIADTVVAVISELKGVSTVDAGFSNSFKGFLGQKECPGVRILVDRNNKVTIDVQIKIQYGLSIPDIARSTQEAIRKTVQETIDVDLKDVNVNVQGIERGEK